MIPGPGTKIPHATRLGQKLKNKQNLSKPTRTINFASKGSSHCLSEKTKDSRLSDAFRSIH